MRFSKALFACVLAAGVGAAGSARADDSDVKSEIDALKRQLAEQARKIRELEGKAPTQDEVSAAVGRYLASTCAAPVLVGGADEGKAGFPKGKKPFIQEGPNKVNFIFRNQVRYEAFLYSDHAKGTLSDTGNPYSSAAPRDRSGFEIERLYLGLEGTIFCEDISYQLILNFDSDTGGQVEKEFAWLDWKYTGEHHVRAGVDKVAYTYEEQNSTGALAFADRSLLTKAFALDSDTGAGVWGYFGGCEHPKQFLYKFIVSTGEGKVDQAGSVFNTDAFGTYSAQPLFAGYLEYALTGRDWAFDEVDNRPCEKRCELDASVGVSGYYENDDDLSHKSVGLVLRNPNATIDRWALNAWFRARWEGWNALAEFCVRNVDYTGGSTSPTQEDMGAEVTLHYRFAESNWGVGVKGGIIWLDSDYDSVTVGPPGNTTTVKYADTISEVGAVVNYFFWDHNNKVTLDATWVQDNSGVTSSAAGYLVDPKKGVIVEDGVMLRLQWQIQF